MKICCCQLAGTDACKNCGELTVGQVNTVQYPAPTFTPNTHFISVNMKQVYLEQYTVMKSY